MTVDKDNFFRLKKLCDKQHVTNMVLSQFMSQCKEYGDRITEVDSYDSWNTMVCTEGHTVVHRGKYGHTDHFEHYFAFNNVGNLVGYFGVCVSGTDADFGLVLQVEDCERTVDPLVGM
jgi:hypothetical protein